MKCYFYFLCAFVYLLVCADVKAQDKIFVIDSVKTTYQLNDFTYFYRDSTKKITIEDVQKTSFLPSMEIYRNPKEIFKKDQHYWYKITIANHVRHKTDFILELSSFNFIEYHIFDSRKQLIREVRTGNKIPYSQRAWHIRASMLPLTIGYQDTVSIVVKALDNSQISISNDILLGTPSEYYEDYLTDIVPQIFFQGAMLLMFFYNLFFFFMVRDRAYLYYALYIVSMAAVSFKDSLPNYFPTRESIYFNELIDFTILFMTVFYVQFIRYFLNIPKIRPHLNRYCDIWLYTRMIIVAVEIVAYIQTPEALFLNTFTYLPFIVDILGGLVLIYASWRVNSRLSAYMIMGYLALALPLLFTIIRQVLGFYNDDYQKLSVQAGVLIELILFSLGLGYRSKLEEKEKISIVEENRRIVQEQNIMLEQKVDERTFALEQTNKTLNATVHTVEKQRDDIVSSINYALRIQNAIIPTEDEMQRYFPESFVFFRPKDIVSGDFYWFADKGDTKIIAVADCTGHGVSGAFMTMIGNNILNQIVNDQDIYQPDEILNLMPILLQKTLSHAEGKVKDGMDISIITIQSTANHQEKQTLTVSYAGAMNPLYYVQNQEFKEIKADKIPIGGHLKEDFKYQKHTLHLQDVQDFTIYLFSDGFQDQFGGAANKKFMVGNFKKLLTSLADKPITTQKQVLSQTFDDWKSEGKQTDDVLIVGLKF